MVTSVGWTFPFFKQWLCWSLCYKWHVQADPTSGQWGWGQGVGQVNPSPPFAYSGGSLWLMRSVLLSWRITSSRTLCHWDHPWLQNLISICLCIENDHKPHFSSEGDAAPLHHTASTKYATKYAPIQSTQHSPYLLGTLTLWSNRRRQNLDSFVIWNAYK